MNHRGLKLIEMRLMTGCQRHCSLIPVILEMRFMYSPIMNSLYIRKNIYRQQNIFVCLCCIETDKVSVRRRQKAKDLEKKRLSLTAEAVTMNQWPKKRKNDSKMKNNSKTTGISTPLPSSATELFKYY